MKRLLLATAGLGLCSAAGAQEMWVSVADSALGEVRQMEGLHAAGLQRQSHWNDENAVPAGSTLQPQAAAQPPTPVKAELSPSAPEIRLYLAKLADTALSPDGLKKSVGMVALEDRERLSKDQSPEDQRVYEELLQQFRTQWKARYAEEFAMAKRANALADYRVLRGTFSAQEAIVASYRPEDQASSRDRLPDNPAGEPVPAAAPEERSATMVIPPNSHLKQPSLTVVFVNETTAGNNWRLKPAPKLTLEKLQTNFQSRVRKMMESQESWPADSREAYRLVSYHLLAAFADQPLDRPQENGGESRGGVDRVVGPGQ